jgi:hypothetical protein
MRLEQQQLPRNIVPANPSTTVHESWLSLTRFSGSLPGREYSHHRTGSVFDCARRINGKLGSLLGSEIFSRKFSLRKLSTTGGVGNCNDEISKRYDVKEGKADVRRVNGEGVERDTYSATCRAAPPVVTEIVSRLRRASSPGEIPFAPAGPPASDSLRFITACFGTLELIASLDGASATGDSGISISFSDSGTGTARGSAFGRGAAPSGLTAWDDAHPMAAFNSD